MDKPIPSIDWQIAENEAAWERLQASLQPDQPPASCRRQQHDYLAAGILLLVFVGMGEWLWQTTWAGTHPPGDRREEAASLVVGWIAPSHDGESGSLPRERPVPNGSRPFVLGESASRAENLADEAIDHVRVEKRAANQAGDLVAMNLVMRIKHRTQAYRQTRFYRRTEKGWQQTEPDATLWGPERSLETPSLVFHFRQQDAPVVIVVAPQIEALYATLGRTFGLPLLPMQEKLDIEVSVTQRPGFALFQRFTEHHLVVPSPAIYLAPVALTDAELLAQSIALPLLEVMVRAASEQHGIGPSWQPVLQGMRLWQVWQMEWPLSVWREEIVRWSYLKLAGAPAQSAIEWPEQYEAICIAHTLWMLSPTQVGIPLFCNELDGQAWYAGTWGPRHPPTRLYQLAVPASDGYAPEGTPLWGQTVALATLIEYTVEQYGRERLPMLVAGLGQYHSWETLIPAVYGVSSDEFEVGWQAYLAARYRVSLNTIAH